MKPINLNLLALSAPGDKNDGFSESLVNNFYNSVRFVKTLADRDPLTFGEKENKCKIKVRSQVSQYCSCDADLTAEQAKDKIRKWI